MASTLPDDLDATGLPDAGSDGGDYDWSPDQILASLRAAGHEAVSMAAETLSVVRQLSATGRPDPETPPPPPSAGEATRWGAQTHGHGHARTRAYHTREGTGPC